MEDPVRTAGQRLSGYMRMGTPEQVRQAEVDLAAAYLDRYIDRAIADGVDTATRRRLAKKLIAGEAQS